MEQDKLSSLIENSENEKQAKREEIKVMPLLPQKDRLMSPLTKKLIFVFILAILLQIPLLFVKGLVSDRKLLHEETVINIGNEWGKAQKIIAPVFILEYPEVVVTSVKDAKTNTEKEVSSTYNKKIAILPDNLEGTIAVKDEVRERGIYSATVYNSNVKLKGYFSKKDFPKYFLENLSKAQQFVSVGLSDTKALMKINSFKLGSINKDLEPMSGTKAGNLFASGISSQLTEEHDKIFENDQIPFEIDIDFRGSKSVSILPLGKKNHFDVTSNWSTPSFTGILPTDKTINNEGFTANWDVSNIVRNYPQVIDLNSEFNYNDFFQDNSQYSDNYSYPDNSVSDSTIKVNLFNSITDYTQIYRACNYGILFIMISLIIVYIFEIVSKKVAHYIQYAVVGASLVIFYLLLLSLSEHIGFEWSYLISSLAIVIPNSLYITSLTGNKKFGLGMFIFLTGVYTILFSILRMKQYALLAGTLLVLSILYIVMYITKKTEIFLNLEKED